MVHYDHIFCGLKCNDISLGTGFLLLLLGTFLFTGCLVGKRNYLISLFFLVRIILAKKTLLDCWVYLTNIVDLFCAFDLCLLPILVGF